ncbi:Hypothetical protein P9211_07291 [Prochlorococcus marinus str. MIT 9211]|uniref:Uncharacterized protein n=1 Tax=Prochlorococcus marinus (strain MIT 9211) TaxID=93059 RepID=A9B9Z8_PROM4|nr:Hypothetical protein P9211_07291 [Prochlorococcus marinus str. MIT 9211]
MNLILFLVGAILLTLYFYKNLLNRQKTKVPFKGLSMRDWMSMNREERNEINRNHNLNTMKRKRELLDKIRKEYISYTKDK